ncbi:MAG TPA: c-type cytochrome [Vicinamibacterales bacterium]|jgi:mono/diheme cytochrome c family protein
MWYTVLALAGSLTFMQAQHPAEGAHHHPEAAKQKNPVAADATSIAAGKQVYEKSCANCHGATGTGDGKMGAELNPKPANLADNEWKHGSSDGEIFAVIKDGVKGTGMRSFNSKLTEHQMWDVINYIHTLAPAKSH